MTPGADGTGGRQTLSLAVKCPQRTSASPGAAAVGAPGLLSDLGPCQPLQRPRPAGSLGALPTSGGGGVGASSAGRVGLSLRGSLGTGGPGSRERGRGGRRKWGRGGHSGLAAEDSSSKRRDPDLRGRRKVPARIPPRSARARLRAPRGTCGTPARRTAAAGTRAGSGPRTLDALRLQSSAHATTTRTRSLPASPHLDHPGHGYAHTSPEGARWGSRVSCCPASQVHGPWIPSAGLRTTQSRRPTGQRTGRVRAGGDAPHPTRRQGANTSRCSRDARRPARRRWAAQSETAPFQRLLAQTRARSVQYSNPWMKALSPPSPCPCLGSEYSVRMSHDWCVCVCVCVCVCFH